MSSRILSVLGIVLVLATTVVSSSVIVFQGIPNTNDPTCAHVPTAQNNTNTMQSQVSHMQSGDTFLIPASNTFCMQGNLTLRNIAHMTFMIDGTLMWTGDQKAWPRQADGKSVYECWYMENMHNITFTSTTQGVLDGNGAGWWGYISYALIGENRPRLFHMHNTTNLLIENIFFRQSPYWTVLLDDVADVVIRHSRIENRVDSADYHDYNNMGAFNTDGFDVSGKNVHIHDCYIWNQDDCIAVKEMDGNGINSVCSENMLFENIFASGVGLTIGSIGSSKAHTCVRNITFRNSLMHNTFKGIYLKSRPANPGDTGEISDVLYENITIFNASQWSLWLGPQQAAYDNACSLFWPYLPGTTCPSPPEMTWKNITFRNILIDSPQTSPGVIAGNATNPMTFVTFDNVTVLNPGQKPWGSKLWFCEGIENSTAHGGSNNPHCLRPV